SLKGMLKDRIRVSELVMKSPSETDDLDKKARKTGQKAEDEKQASDKDENRRLLSGIKKLQGEGKLGQARLLSGELATRHANVPAAKAADRIASTNEQIASNRQLQNERERGTSGVLRDVDRSARPPTGDIEFPKDWKERTKNRASVGKQTLTAKELQIFRGLDNLISPTFKDSRLEDVIEYLHEFIGQPIVLDPLAM